jgi:hypothetical protein
MLDRRQLRERRQTLKDRLNFASWGAIAAGSLGAIFALVWFFQNDPPLQAFLAMLASCGMQFLLAYQVRQRHEIAAGSMVVGYAMTLAWKWYVLGDFSGILYSGAMLVVYVRGFLAAIDLTELDQVYGAEPTVN